MNKEEIEKSNITVEFSKDPKNANIAILGAIENNQKVVNLYKVDRNTYEPKFEIKEVSRNVKDLQELVDNSKLICKLKFNNKESIESLIYVLKELYYEF